MSSNQYRIVLEIYGIAHHYWCVELDRAFFYAPRPLIDRAPGNDVTSLTTYTTHTRVGDTNIYIYKHTSNPWESNHRDGPTGHKN